MAIKFATGQDAFDAADAARGSGSGGFTPFVKLAAGEKKYLQFVTPLDDIPAALIHQYVIVDYKDNGDAVYANFISPRDKSIDGPSGDDPIQDRFGLAPSLRLFAVAVELEPTLKTVGGKKTITGFEPKMRTWTDREDEEHETIVAGVVVQAKANFFGHLQTWAEENDDDITNVIWAVSRDDNTKQPTYSFVANSKHAAIDLSEYGEDIPDLDGFLQEIADEDRLHEKIDPLPDDFRITKFPQQKKETAKKSSSSKANTKSKAPVEDEDEFETTDEKKARQKGGTGRLAARIAAADVAEAEANDDADDDE